MDDSVPSASAARPLVRLHAATAGSGPTVVCLHSSASASSQWRRLVEDAQSRYRLVTVDFHGHGRSPEAPRDGYTLRTESDAVWDAIAGVAGPVHLVGHSFGGAVALDLAVRHAGRFESVVVYEPVLFGLLERGSEGHRDISAVGRAIVRDARSGWTERASETFIDYWSGAGSWAAMTTEQQERVRSRIVAVAAHFDALFADPVPPERLRLLRAPTLLLHGDCSPRAARDVSARLAGVAGIEARLLPGVGHMGPVTHAAAVNAHILAHLDAATGIRRAA